MTSSTRAEETTIVLISDRISPNPPADMPVCASSRVRTPNCRVTDSANKDEIVTIPRPPTWIPARITTCPAVDQYVAVSTVVRPVTATAEAAVNTASCRYAEPSEEVAHGIFSSTVNTAIAAANAKSAERAGELKATARTTRAPEDKTPGIVETMQRE